MIQIFKNTGRYYYALRHLRIIQILYLIRYRIVKPISLKKVELSFYNIQALSFSPFRSTENSLSHGGEYLEFTFLNKTRRYHHNVDWSDQEYGRLWNYHLQYAGFLQQKELPLELRNKLILDFYHHLYEGSVKPEPYTASLRVINTIRFLSEERLDSSNFYDISAAVFSEMNYLVSNPEFHILGNHLLENAFALLMSGTYFKDEKIISRSSKILFSELEEQILNDGAHFERSPMYHNLILFRVLEACDYLDDEVSIKSFLRVVASGMLGWAVRMRYSDGATPHFNDSVNGVAPDTDKLLQLASQLDIEPDCSNPLSDSGYRKIDIGPFELFMDLEGIEPSYQPGHAHADSLSIQLHMHGKPFLTDPGVSTYEVGERRNWERSTKAHNTLSASGRNSADVWAGFRVGKRPFVKILTDQPAALSATLEYGADQLTRTLTASEDTIIIKDQVISSTNEGISFFHFAPDIRIVKVDRNQCILNNGVKLLVSESATIVKKRYLYAEGFNLLKEAEKIEIRYDERCVTTIYGS